MEWEFTKECGQEMEKAYLHLPLPRHIVQDRVSTGLLGIPPWECSSHGGAQPVLADGDAVPPNLG